MATDLTNSNDSVNNAAPVNNGPVNVAAGLGPNDPSGQGALADLQRQRSGFGFAAQSALMGAGQAAGATQNATNPLSAFLQGAAIGMQAPAQMYAQKRDQIQSTIDATPFGITHPDVAKDPAYSILAGVPTALALQLLAKSAVDTAHVMAQSKADLENQNVAHKGKMEELRMQYVAPGKEAENAAQMLSNTDQNGRIWTAAEVAGLPKDTLASFLKANADAGGSLFGRGRKLNPQELDTISTMVKNNQVSATDTMSKFQIAQLASYYGQKFPGDNLNARIASAKNLQNPQVQQQVRTMQSIVHNQVDPETGEPMVGIDGKPMPSLADQVIAAHAALHNTEKAGPLNALYNEMKTKYSKMTSDEKLVAYTQLKNSYAMEVSKA